MSHPQHAPPRTANRRRLIHGLIAACVLCLGALLPSASGSESGHGDRGGEGREGGSQVGSVLPAEEPSGADGGPRQ